MNDIARPEVGAAIESREFRPGDGAVLADLFETALPGEPRRGVATRLITEAMTLARRAGSTRFWLSTGGHDQVAQALYDSLDGDRKPLGDVNYWWTLD